MRWSAISSSDETPRRRPVSASRTADPISSIECASAIVRWAAIRIAVRDQFGVDRDAANLAEPLIPAAVLRAHVLAGEARAAGREIVDDGSELIALVERIRLG
jgi:hypothetical protein